MFPSLGLGMLMSLAAMMCCYGQSDHIRYREGDINLLLTVPHGGKIKPSAIPERTDGCWINGACVFDHTCAPTSSSCTVNIKKDLYTNETAWAIADWIEQETGFKPHLVINRVHRSRLDMNRAKDEATLGVAAMEIAYDAYTDYINQAKAAFNGSPGLLLDIHGVFNHKEKWVELGYCISKSKLESGDFVRGDSSIDALGARKCGDGSECFDELVRGDTSLGHMLSEKSPNYDVVPSPKFPSPGVDGGYYSGGYTVQTHGSKDGGTVDAIQIETPSKYRKKNDAATTQYIEDLASAIWSFFEANYMPDPDE